MKKHLFIPLFVFTLSCNTEKGEENNKVIENQQITSSSDSLIDLNQNVIEEKAIQNENIEDKWQIDDYVELLMGAKIYTSWDEIHENETAGASFYEILDIKGGFARITGAYEGAGEFVMWRMEDGNDIVGKMSMGCGPACDYSYQFYVCNKETTQKIELKNIMPIAEMDKHKVKMHEKALKKFNLDYPEDISYIFNFPRKGTSMEVDIQLGADEVHVPILRLSWDKSKFNIEQLYEEVNEKTFY